jgi:hypothetical protein
MYLYINYYVKGPLEFYNDEEDMLPTPKPLRKPWKWMTETLEQYHKRVQEWEASKPLLVI